MIFHTVPFIFSSSIPPAIKGPNSSYHAEIFLLIPDSKLRRMFRKQIDAAGISLLSPLGLVACEAAYSQGEEWYLAMKAYVSDNIDFIRKYTEENLPGVSVTEHEGTYLVWLDFRKTGLNAYKHSVR
ncbi:MAG: hypothetical protein PUB89_07215 [Oscillospiraceae bacterium]|nr:hypothetical protein [Oscillospiraceae bacterium]MDD6082615.1 hypothetical protein [Oscillospiraceae bacterium]